LLAILLQRPFSSLFRHTLSDPVQGHALDHLAAALKLNSTTPKGPMGWYKSLGCVPYLWFDSELLIDRQPTVQQTQESHEWAVGLN
jgi:hypothetical protein